MSLIRKIERKLYDISYDNSIATKSILVTEEKVLTERRYIKEIAYKVKIIFIKEKTLLDVFFAYYFPFNFKFKVYRTYYNREDNSLNFSLKPRNLRAIYDILEEE